MIVIYIAGAIANPSAWVREQNIIRAETALLAVLDAGMAGICVHSGARTFFGERPEELFLQADFALIERVDALLLVPGWEKSKGTAKEIAFAHSKKIPVFERLGDLKRWAEAARSKVGAIVEELLEDWRTVGAQTVGASLDEYPEPWLHPEGVADPRVGWRIPPDQREHYQALAIDNGALAPAGSPP